MPGLPKELSDWLNQFGIDRKSFKRIRFGGVIGKQALVGVIGLIGLVLIARKADGLLLWGCLAAIFILTIIVVVAMGIHGDRHPLEATLEGGEVVVMQHLRQEVAAKGLGIIPVSSPIPEGIGQKPITENSN